LQPQYNIEESLEFDWLCLIIATLDRFDHQLPVALINHNRPRANI
jgi:hypothetical protein